MEVEPSTPHLDPVPYSSISEDILGVIYIILMTIGIPSNIISVIYFSRQKVRPGSTREFFKWIYTNIACTDLLVCVFCFPMATVFLSPQRNSPLFLNDMFCAFWAFAWELLPYYSVYLVLVLSWSRMAILIRPMIVLNKQLLIISLVLYNILLLTTKVAFFYGDITQIDYTKRDALCILTGVDGMSKYYPIYTFFNIILLAMPIIPICISCVSSVVKMYKTDMAVKIARRASTNGNGKAAASKSSKRSAHRHKHATTTVIIMTVTYILCNLPVFVNYVAYGYWSVMSAINSVDYRSIYGTHFLYYYSWSSCLVLAVLLNSTINPIVYATRMREFRNSIIYKCEALEPTDTIKTLYLGHLTGY
eukprot:sb/3465985/